MQFCQIDHDGARLHDADARAMVHDRWNLVIRADLQELWLELIPRTDINRMGAILQPKLFEQD